MHSRSPILCYSEVLGQARAKKLVSRSLASQRLPHAYIFKGPDGVGKRLFARGLAAAINCRGDQPGRACGSCRSCRKLLSDNHPDFMVVNPDQGAIKIGQVREMCRALAYPPYESAMRVVLLEDIHTMRQEAANSLLKTLEEPPASNLLVLTAESSQEILTTISSRCQAIAFQALSETDTVRVIRDREPELGEQTAHLLARLAEGSPGRALLLHDAEMMPIFGQVAAAVSNAAVDGDRDAGLLLRRAEEMAGLKEQLPPFLGLLRLWLRDMLFGDEDPGSQTGLRGWGLEDGQELKYWSSEEIFAKLRAVDRAEEALRRNCNRTLVCEVLLFQLHNEGI